MAATPPATLIDVIVLVFARSELKSVVGTDALRTVLNGSQRELFPEPNTLSLQAIWDLLESQPGFTVEAAAPPMCRLKTWEGQLKVKVEMPVALEVLDAATREKKAMLCNAGDDALHQILKPPSTAPAAQTARVIESGTVTGDEKVAKKRRLPLGVALGFAAVGIIAAVISIYLTVGRGGSSTTTVKLAASDLTTEFPIANVRRSGTLIVATLSDPAAWRKRPELERRKLIENTTAKVRAQEATGLMLVDTKGLLLAMLRLDKTPPQITFPRR